ncbi:MGA_1079 family surface serine endopeptidase [Mycoplasma sp. AC157]
MIKNKVCMMKINKKTIMVFSVPIIALTLGITTTSILITKKINNEKINKQNNQLKSFIYNQPNSELDSLLEKFYFKFINNNDLNLYQKEKLSLNLQKFVSEYNAFLSKPLTLLNSRIEKKYPDLLKKSNELIEFKNKIKKIVSNINLNNFNFEDNTNQLIEKNKDIVYINQQNKNLNDELDIFSTKINSTNFYNNFLLKLVDKNFLNDIMDVNFSYSNYFQKIKNLDLEINEIKDTISFLDFYFEKSDSNLKNEINQITNKYKEKIQEKSVFSLSLSNLSQVNKYINIILNDLNSFISLNNLFSDYLIYKKEEFLIKINNSSFLSKEQKKTFTSKLKEVNTIIKEQYLEIEFNNELENFQLSKSNLITEINQSIINEKSKSELINNVKSLKSKTEILDFKNTLEELFSKIENLKILILEFENGILNNNLSGQKQFNFLKEKIKLDSFIKNNELLDVDIFDLTKSIDKVDQFISKLNEIKNGTDATNDGLQTIFDREATANLSNFQLNSNTEKFDLKQYLYSGSINLKNSNLYFGALDTDFIDYTIFDLQLKENNRNILVVTIDAVAKTNSNLHTTIRKEIDFSTKDITPIINNISIANLDEIYDINYFELSKIKFREFLENETYKKYLIKKKQGISNFFSYDILPNFSLENNTNKLQATVNVLFNKQIIKTFNLTSLKAVEFENENTEKDDEINRNKILQLLSGPVGDLLEEFKFKDGVRKTHTDYYSKDAKIAIENSYILPKYGRYEIYVENVESYNNIKDAKYKNKGGDANVFFWYKIDGQKAPLPENKSRYIKTVDFFRHFTYEAIKPINGKQFTAADFKWNYSEIEENFKTEINKINETNFQHRKVQGKAIKQDQITLYRAFNIKDFLFQNHLEKMNYFFKLANATDDSALVGQSYDNDWFVPLDAKLITKSGVTKSNANLNDLLSKYFYYFYDIKQINKWSLSFKIGFINILDNTKRFTNEQEYVLDNVVNDYQQELYPAVILNKITLSDINVNKEQLKEHDVTYYRNNLDELNRIITLNYPGDEIEYNNFSLPKNRFKISEIQNANDDFAFVRFAFYKKDDSVIKSDVWYKISGFKKITTNEGINKLTFDNNKLNTVFYSENEVERERELEPFWKDLIWTLDPKTNVASWVLKKQYIEKTFLASGTKNRSFKLTLFGNVLSVDNDKDDRIRNETKVPKFYFDFEELVTGKLVIKEGVVGGYKFPKGNTWIQVPPVEYILSAKYDENTGISFTLKLKNPEYKIIIDTTYTQPNDVNFSPSRAFILNFAPAKIVMKYINSKQNEHFSDYKTNQYNYEHVNYDLQQQPILHYNDENVDSDYNVYNPNQNVIYKIHEGYKPDREWIRSEWHNWELVNTVKSRAIKYVPNINHTLWNGSATIIAKVNDDINNHRFYVLTNHHVEKEVDKLSKISGENLPYKPISHRNIFIESDKYRNDINDGFGYPSTRNEVGFGQIPTKILWVGTGERNQISKDSKQKGNYDAAVSIIDWGDYVKEAKREGRMGIVKHFQNLQTLENVKLDVDYKTAEIFVPNITDMAHLGFPYWGSKTGYINHRPDLRKNSVIFAQSPNFSPLYFGSGNSGSGMFVDKNSLVGLWTSGNGGGTSEIFRYDTDEYNFFGINWNNENPLNLKNTGSFGAQIIRANAKNPNDFSLPWFWKEIK